MNTYPMCETVYKFPVLNTWSEQLFGYSILNPFPRGGKSPLNRFRLSLSSFTVEEFKLYERKVSAAKKEAIIEHWLAGDFLVASIADRMKYMLVCSMITRLVELASLSLQTQVNQSTKLGPYEKLALIIILNLLQYAVIGGLGYASFEITAYTITTHLLAKILPYALSNFVREMDFLSNGKYLQVRDFFIRNVLVFARNFFVTRMVFHVFAQFINMVVRPPFFDSAEIRICDSGYGPFKIAMLSNTSLDNFREWMEEFAWVAGKMLFDIIFSYILINLFKVKDLRDPLHTLLSPEAREWIGSYKEPQELPKKAAVEREQGGHNKRLPRGSKAKQPQVQVEYDKPAYSYVNVDSTLNKAGKAKKGKRIRKKMKVSRF